MSTQSLGYAQADKRIELLRRVGESGSISQAARSAGVSYKAAWQAIHTLTNLAGEPLVDSSVGGVGGGGARITPAGQQLLAAAGAVQQARSAVLAQLGGDAGADADAVVARLSVRTSMRNQWPCIVQGMQACGQIVRVHLRGAGDAAQLQVFSRITRESAELLGLRPGVPVQALCKATAVRVQPMDAAAPQGGANLLPGRVLRMARGVQRDEVTVTLAGELQLVGFAARPNRLRAGSRALAWLDESAVVVALAG